MEPEVAEEFVQPGEHGYLILPCGGMRAGNA